MRQERTVQASLFDRFADHEIGRARKAMSQWLGLFLDKRTDGEIAAVTTALGVVLGVLVSIVSTMARQPGDLYKILPVDRL